MLHAKVKLVTLFSPDNEKGDCALAGSSRLGLFFAVYFGSRFDRYSRSPISSVCCRFSIGRFAVCSSFAAKGFLD